MQLGFLQQAAESFKGEKTEAIRLFAQLRQSTLKRPIFGQLGVDKLMALVEFINNQP